MTDDISEPRWHQRSTLHHAGCVCWHPDIPGDPTAAAKAKQAGVHGDGWPYGPNIHLDQRIALLAWTEATGYRRAQPRRICLHWLTGQIRRCSALQRSDHAGVLMNETLRNLDHPTCWTRNGKPALLLAQPYGPPAEDWVAQLERDWPVDVRVEPQSPWYGHGTVGVFLTARAS